MKILSDITINQYKLHFIGFVDYVGLSFMCLYRLVDYSKLRDITLTGLSKRALQGLLRRTLVS